ncbi:hypothetical protein BGX38DRAFT_608904 [Terfezia claveryi]|nr:hypothetical protein BGX38DRAFT_608904 [Terfezia claveryi]
MVTANKSAPQAEIDPSFLKQTTTGIAIPRISAPPTQLSWIHNTLHISLRKPEPSPENASTKFIGVGYTPYYDDRWLGSWDG